MTGPERTELSFGEFVGVLLRRWRVLALGGLLGGLGATGVVGFSTPVYVAEARVLIGDTDAGGGLLAGLANMPGGLGRLVSGSVPTAAEMEVMRSLPVVEAVVLPPGLDPTAPEVGQNLLVRVEDLDRLPLWRELVRKVRRQEAPRGALDVEIELSTETASDREPIMLEFLGADEVRLSKGGWFGREERTVHFSPGVPFEFAGAEIVLHPSENLGGRRFHVARTTLPRALKEFRRNLALDEPLRGSNVVRISYPDTDPVRAARIANALVDAYVARNKARLREEAGAAIESVEAEIERVRGELEAAEQDLVAFGQRSGPIALPETATALIDRMAEAAAERRKTEFRAGSIRDLLGSIREGALTAGDLAGLEATGEESSALVEPLASLLERARSLEATYTDEWPELKELRVRIDERANGLQEALEAELWREEEALRGLEELAASFQDELDRMPEAQVELIRFRRRVETFTEVYTFLIGRREDALIRKGSAIPAVEIIERAVPPLIRRKPKIRSVLGVGGVAGLLLGVLAAFTLERRRPRLRLEDLEALARAPGLGELPRPRRGDGALPAAGSGSSATSYAVLAASVTHALFDTGARVLAVVSPVRPGLSAEVAANLAVALAQAGRRVALVDATSARPDTARAFGLDPAENTAQGFVATASGVVLGTLESLAAAEGEHETLILALGDPETAVAMGQAKRADALVFVAEATPLSTEELTGALGRLRRIGARLGGVVLRGS